MNDPTRMPLVHVPAGAAGVTVETHSYPTAHGDLPFHLYRPPGAATPRGAVVFVSGYPDPGMIAMLGTPLEDWASYVDWARAVAATGLVAITYRNHEPADVAALIDHLRGAGAALGVDPARIGAWACSGNVPTALAALARHRLAAAALLYGYALDLDGATEVAAAAAQFHFATPPVGLDALPAAPLLVVRAGADATPGLVPSLDRFVAAARARGLPVTVIDHADAPHAFDLVDDSPRTRAVIEEVLGFLERALA